MKSKLCHLKSELYHLISKLCTGFSSDPVGLSDAAGILNDTLLFSLSLGKPAVSLEKQTVLLEQCELCHLVSKPFVGFSSDTAGLSSETVGLNKWYLVSCVSWKFNCITWKGWLRSTKSTAWSVKMNNIAYCSHVTK